MEELHESQRDMTPNARACTPTDTLAAAARFMWDNDCGILPVVADGGKVIGLITDREICMAAAMNNRNLSNIAVADVISGKVYAASPDDDVRKALEIMRETQDPPPASGRRRCHT